MVIAVGIPITLGVMVALRTQPEEVLIDACVEFIAPSLPTAPTFELIEGAASVRSGEVRIRYARQNLYGATIVEHAVCGFEPSANGPLQLLQAYTTAYTYPDLSVRSWNLMNRMSGDWTWPESP